MRTIALLCVFLPAIASARQPDEPLTSFGEALIIGPVGSSQRAVIAADSVAASLVAGRWVAPRAGDKLDPAAENGPTWTAAAIGDDGGLRCRANGYAYVPFTATRAGVLVLSASGHGMVYVNGTPRPGDPYQTGYCHLPIAVDEGPNWLLFRTSRPDLRVSLTAPPAAVYVDPADSTLPDLVRGQAGRFLGAVVVVNATPQWAIVWSLAAGVEGGLMQRTAVNAIPPLSILKAPFEVQVEQGPPGESAMLRVKLVQGSADADRPGVELPLRVRAPDQSRKVTFRSRIDGSVQYYAARPALDDASNSERPGMILTLHGAGVEGIGQADAYQSKTWAHIVAPTNRRPFGFDWEDWGRLDFLEVVAEAKALFAPDDRKVWLTGHSMGGHGTWQIGAQFPGLFGAIAPSAGWISMRSYAGAAAYDSGTPIENILRRASSPSDTLALKGNYQDLGVYILHGDADDNVPVAQARTMRGELASFHSDFAYYERPGAGHWWGGECVDWPPLMDFLRQHPGRDRLGQRRTRFTTMSPVVSASPCGWATVESQIEPMKPSSVDLTVDPGARAFAGTTTNVAGLTLTLGMLPAAQGEGIVHMDLDGQTLEAAPIAADQQRLALFREDGQWKIASPPPPGDRKSPAAGGPFKDVFRNDVALIVGTAGSEEENSWSLARARMDSETFWYRGNGSLNVVLDTDYAPAAFTGRNVVLYGNARTNRAWDSLLRASPVQVVDGKVVIGDRSIDRPDLACLFLRPKPGEPGLCVGVIGGTGIQGMRLTGSVPYFRSGTALPDWLIVGPEALQRGTAGILGAGFFGNDWGTSEPNSAWSLP